MEQSALSIATQLFRETGQVNEYELGKQVFQSEIDRYTVFAYTQWLKDAAHWVYDFNH